MSEQDVNNDNPTNWKDTIENDYKEVVERFNEPKDLAKGYAELLKLDSSKVKIPDEKASPEDVAKFWSKIGVPQDVKEYALPEGIQGDEGFVTAMKQIAKEANVPKGQFSKLAEGYIKYQQDFENAQIESVKKLNDERWSKYKAEWGPDTTAENIALAKKAFGELAPEELKELMTEEDVEKDPILVKMYSNIWRKTTNDILVKGTPPKPPVEPKKEYEPEFYEKYGDKIKT